MKKFLLLLALFALFAFDIGLVKAQTIGPNPTGSASADVTVGTSAITGGTTTRVLYDNAGVLGEYTISGNTSVCMTVSCSMTTPTLGVALATSINGNVITTGTGTLTLGAGKVFTASSTLTLTATDGSTLAIGGGGTLGTNAYTSTAYAPLANPTFTGTVVIPTPFTLGAVSVTSTGTQLNYLSAATGTTGTTSTNLVYSTSPTFITPILGTPTSGTLSNTTGFPTANLAGAGTGVLAALALNVGSAGAPVLFNGAGGTPSAITLTNGTGLPIAGTTGYGTGVATALALNVGSAGAPVTFNGAGGTPSSLTLTNASGTPSAITLTNGTGLPIAGTTGYGTGVATALAVNVGSAGAPVTFNGALGTPSSGTATNITGVTLSGHATQATNTVVGNATSGTASPTALAVGTCSTAASALIWTTNTGFGCNTSITAAAIPANGLTGTTLSASVVTSSITTVGTIASGVWNAGSVTTSGSINVTNSGQSVTNYTAAAGGSTGYILGRSVSGGNTDDFFLYSQAVGNIFNVAVTTGLFTHATSILLSAAITDATKTDNTLCRDTTTGQVYKGSGTIGICLGTSSMRFKKDIVKTNDALDQILALEPVNFHYIPGYGDDGAREQYGFLAEDVVNVLPKLVGLDVEGKPLSVDILGMVPVLVQAIKELKAEIDTLRKR